MNFEKIAIVGNGLSAWMITALMAKQLRHTKTKITLHVGVEAEITTELQSPLPLFESFLRAIEISPDLLTEKANFHPKLGTAFLFNDKPPFFHVWGQYGAPIGPIEFHQVLMRFGLMGETADLNKLSLGAASILAGKFQKPTPNSQSIYSTYESSWSFETAVFVNVLKSISSAMGVEVNGERVSKVEVGDACVVWDESDRPHEYSYLINTIPDLIGGSHAYESWFPGLPFTLRTQSKTKNTLSPLVNKVKVIDSATWLCEITHRNLAVLNVYQFEKQDMGSNYVHKSPRSPKCLNFGPAMANLCSPLFSAIDLNSIASTLLLRYFPAPTDGTAVVGEFNAVLRSAFENLRDLTQLCVNQLFLRECHEEAKIPLSPQAEYKSNLFKARGRYPFLESEFFKTEWQVWLLLGLGFEYGGVEPMVSFIKDDAIREHISKVENSVMRSLSAMPKLN